MILMIKKTGIIADFLICFLLRKSWKHRPICGMILIIKSRNYHWFLDMVFADEKLELSTSLWHAFNIKKLEISLIFGYALCRWKASIIEKMWHDFNDKKQICSCIFGYVFLAMKSQSCRQMRGMILMIKSRNYRWFCDMFFWGKAGAIA